MTQQTTPADPLPSRKSAWRRWWPLLLLLAGLAAFFASGLHRHVTFDSLAAEHAQLMALTQEHHLLALIIAMAAYALATALSLPIGTPLTLMTGYLFGIVEGSLLVIVGATLGSVVVFLAARGALREPLQRRAGPWLGKMERGFKENALSYLLILRLLPLFPFWLVNLVPGLLGVPLRTYLIGTALGIIPGTVIYVAVGNGLGSVFAKGETPDLGIVFEPRILLPLLGLCVLALLPILYKRWKKSH